MQSAYFSTQELVIIARALAFFDSAIQTLPDALRAYSEEEMKAVMAKIQELLVTDRVGAN